MTALLAAPAGVLASSGPAGGAPLSDLIAGAIAGTVLTAAVLALAVAHRRGTVKILDRLADLAARLSGMPRWYALPAAITAISLLVAVFGFYWDVGTHIDHGRDEGPFGSIAHYPILLGLGGIALGGVTALVLGMPERDPTAFRLPRGWTVPLGGVLIFVCGVFALSGFPLDDAWHRLFGQDVTLWGPTHVLMIAGASLATLGMWVLLVEVRRARARARGGDTSLPWFMRFRAAATAGAFLVGVSTLQGEFDYGVPQFQLVFHPILLMLAAGLALVPARIYLGRGGALAAVAFFLVLRGLLTLVIGPALGESTLHFPLYLAEAAVVELVAWRMGDRRPIALGAVAGALIGTVGLAAEWGWSHVWMPLPWPASLLPEAAILGLAAAVSGGVLGALIGAALTSERRPRIAGSTPAAIAAGAVAIFCIAFPLPMTAGEPTTAQVALRDVAPPPEREATATVRIEPASAADDADWLTITAWQGGGLVVDRLRRTGPGSYETTRPIPLHGDWKAMVRLADGRAVRAAPIYMPADAAIPAEGVPAPPRFTRELVRDKDVLQREARGGSAALSALAYLTLLAIVAIWIGAMTWGLRRLSRPGAAPEPAAAPPSPRTPEPVGAQR